MPKPGSHEEWIELCALSTSGELTDEEWLRLERHLLDCPSCRERKRQYESVVANLLPAVAEASDRSLSHENESRPWPIEGAEAELMASLDRRHSVPKAGVARRNPDSAPRWPYGIAATVLLCGGTLLGLILGRARPAPERAMPVQSASHLALPAAPPVASPVPAQARPANGDLGRLRQELEQKNRELARLQASLSGQREAANRLQAKESQLEQQISDQADRLLAARQQNADLQNQITTARSQLAVLEGKLAMASQARSAGMEQIAALENNIAVLNVELKAGDTEVSRDEVLLEHDRDIRNLMGARDLYIAEIYDSGKDGRTKKPFGRIFYTKNRSLIFYAYDLDQQPGVEKASAFQAWGSTGAGGRDVSLGLFYHDSADKKRWVLKCDDPQTIARLNAVFVTIEPKGGSAKPTGKRLLFSYLRVNPNHP